LIDFDRTTTGYNLEIARQEIATLLTEASAVTYSPLSGGLCGHWQMDDGPYGELSVTTSDGTGADTFIRGGSYQDDNYGGSASLPVKLRDATFTRTAYLRFDISNMNFNAASATLSLKKAGGAASPTTIKVYALKESSNYGSGKLDESWIENGVNGLKASNAPGTDGNAAIDSNYVTYLGNFSWDGTTASLAFTNLDFLNNDTNGKVTLILYKGNSENNSVDFASKEHSTLAEPTLTITNRTVHDSVGGNDGTLNGSGYSWTSAGRLDGALSLSGGNDYVEVSPFNYELDAITASFWMKTSDTSKLGTPISCSDGATQHNEFLIYNYQNFSIWIDGGHVTTNISANDGNWHHITVTWRSSDGQVKLYKDGDVVYSGTLKQGSTINPANLILGQEQDSFGGGFAANQAFKGLIDDVRIYNRAISADTVAALNMSQLNGHWQLNETSGTNATDTAKGHNGTVQGSGSSWLAGRLANSLKLTGSAAVSVPHTSDLNPGGSTFTISAWVKTTATSGMIIYKGRNGSTHDRYYLQMTGGKPQFVFDSGQAVSTLTLTGPAMINDGQWHHIAAVRTGTKTGALYVDDATPVTGAYSGTYSGVDTNGPFYIGRDSGTAN
ncbi:MAG: DNRLRE domain-containing protein, partial [Phycisphaerae bacterium]|nr:DNRLRE domain-containing protein [Phycisphaerae bacterium]